MTEGAPAPLATWTDVQARWRPLSDAEQGIATARLLDASALLRRLAPGIDARAAEDPIVADLVTATVANAVLRVMRNPDGAKQLQESAGPFSHGMTLTEAASGVFFTDAELLPLRDQQALIGTSYVAQRRGWAPGSPYRKQGWPGGPLLPPYNQGYYGPYAPNGW